MTAVTDLQKQRQQDQAQINLGAAQGYSVTPNQGSVVPNVMQSQKIYEAMLAQKNSIPNIEPPSEGEIRRESWIASGVMGLLGALVTGNPASGIAIGMQAALALHDHGYDLRQRAEHVWELHQQGYSALAIEKWYETGDNSELDKERQNMEAMTRDQFNSDAADRRQQNTLDQQKTFHADEMENTRLAREQSQRNADRMYTLDEAKFLLDKQKADAAASGNVDTKTAIKNLQQLATHNNTENTKVKNATDFVVKGLTAPSTQAGAQQLGMSAMGAETGVSPRPTQVTHMIEEWAPGSMGAVGTWIEQASNNGIPESGMQAGRTMLMNNAKSMWGENAQNAINTLSNQGYDTSNPNVMQAMQNAYPNIPSDSLKKLVDGNMTADQYAEQQAEHYQNLYRPGDSDNTTSESTNTTSANASNKERWPDAPDIGSTSDGYKYKGGNPANPASWEKA
ncbi:hypothetical protein RWF45_001066 [Salmonella enterica]|nr:hypothetical protein [Salmonella enterica]EJU7779411.1 hypothetical protein [Salmonella enterica subsp. arizonae serovar 56:z36:-]EBM4471247.1 hypothetical protein [Salmonella enterica]EFR2122788.1 hypothetical protein [Salmonella enterica]EIB1174535.1 hypothetical protein [Salmonella enterica]